ncbi:hypothetical protein BC835DRAFT_300693 [Cytidiella melzeri]|nr:hypothetical protein BC835DRAFT_300693 [Cytidiella melzeri]
MKRLFTKPGARSPISSVMMKSAGRRAKKVAKIMALSAPGSPPKTKLEGAHHGSDLDFAQAAQTSTRDVVARKALEGKRVLGIAEVLIEDLLEPVKEVAKLLEAISSAHPATKALAGLVKVVVKMEISRRDNEKQIVAVLYSMTSMLFLLQECTSMLDNKSHLHGKLQDCLQDMYNTIRDFSNFCDFYYSQRLIVRAIRSGDYRSKLKAFASRFEDQKKDLQVLIGTKTVWTVMNIQADLQDVIRYLDDKSALEKKAEACIKDMGGLHFVLDDTEALDKFAERMGEKIDAGCRQALKEDLSEALKSNELLYNEKFGDLSRKLRDAAYDILEKLNEGPHAYIEDDHIKSVWKELGPRISTKTRVFLDALYVYFNRIFRNHEHETGKPHRDTWTLHFLSKIIFYRAIGERLDEDSSGFVSVHELGSRPLYGRRPINTNA